MRRGWLFFLTLAAGLPAAVRADPGPPPPEVPPPPPYEPMQRPYYSCVVEREAPGGTVSAFKLIERSGGGREGERLHTWVTDLTPGGVQLHAVWTDDPPAESGWIDILFPLEDSADVYRFQILRTAPPGGGGRQWETGLLRPSEGSLDTSISWGEFMDLLAGAADPRIVVRGADGTVLRSDPVDLSGFARAVALGDSLEPELDAMVADYRNRCQLIESFVPMTVATP